MYAQTFAILRESSNLIWTIARVYDLKHGANVEHELFSANRLV